MQIRPLRTVLLVPGFAADEQDSTCIPALQALVRALAAIPDGPSLEIIAFQYPFKRGAYHWHGIPVYACAGGNRGGIRRLATWLRAARRVWYCNRQAPLTHIHSFWLEETALLGQWLARLLGLPQIASVMGQDAREENRFLRYLNFSRLRLTAGSVYAAQQPAISGTEVTILPIGLRVADLPASRPPAEVETDILGVGALTALKNVLLFVELVAEVRERYPGIRAEWIGSGPLENQVRSKVRELKLEAHLQLRGALPRAAVLERMSRSRILLHPSQYESQGYVLLEALYCGLEVVCFPVGYSDLPGISRCSNREEMRQVLLNLLAGPTARRSKLPLTAADTAAKLLDIYRQSRQTVFANGMIVPGAYE